VKVASNVLGRADFTHNNATTATQSGMSGPTGVSYDSANNWLFVTEANNNRMLNFTTANVISAEKTSDILARAAPAGTDAIPHRSTYGVLGGSACVDFYCGS
jgi:DNA-binding beta-propeller fold protein YncE